MHAGHDLLGVPERARLRGGVERRGSGCDRAVIERDEIVALLFNVADIACAVIGIETLLREDETVAKRKRTKAEREEFEARSRRTMQRYALAATRELDRTSH